MTDPKPARIDAWESRLTDEQQRELYRWTQTPIEDESGNLRRPNFDECMARVDTLGVGRPSRTAWFRFKARMEKERRLEMLYSVKGSGESAKDLTTMSPADYELAANAFTNLAISETEEEFDALEKNAKVKAKVIALPNGSKIYALPGKLGTVIDETTGKERPKTAEEYVEECREAPAR